MKSAYIHDLIIRKTLQKINRRLIYLLIDWLLVFKAISALSDAHWPI